MNFTAKFRLLLAVTVGIILCSVASATTIVPMSVEHLTQTSTHVVVAHAMKSWSSWDAQHTRITTYTQFSVDSWLKGSGANAITVKQPGGSAEGYTQHVSGVRPWSNGETAVLFLQPSPTHDSAFVVSGLIQGDFRVRHLSSGATIADNGVSSSAEQVGDGVQSFNPSNKSVSPYNGTRISLHELESRIRSTIQSR